MRCRQHGGELVWGWRTYNDQNMSRGVSEETKECGKQQASCTSSTQSQSLSLEIQADSTAFAMRDLDV